MKKCSRCGETKPLSEFHKSKHTKSGFVFQCKPCIKEKHAIYYMKNKEKIDLANKEYRENNPDRAKALARKSYQLNKEKVNERARRWHKENPDKARDATIKWRTNNRQKQCQATRDWKKRNPNKVRVLKQGQYQRYKQDISFVLAGRVSNALRYSLKNNNTKANRKWEDLVDFTIDQLKAHLEKKFTPKMTWENYGTYWHIDHKTPIAVFNFEKPEDIDFKICWSLKNLQPLEASINMSKGAKIDKPFQPSLAIAV